jgi:hypothetical protein
LNAERKCPYCKSANIEGNINRIKGEGESHFSSSSFLFSHHSSGDSKFELDTHESFKCLDCHRAWNKPKYKSKTSSDVFEEKLKRIGWYRDALKEIDALDPFDPKFEEDKANKTRAGEQWKKDTKEMFGGLFVETIAIQQTKQFFDEFAQERYFIQNFSEEYLKNFDIRTDLESVVNAEMEKLSEEQTSKR